MWMTLIFYGTAVLFLIRTLSALWHLRWVRRLPALEKLTAAHSPGSGLPENAIRCSVVIAAQDEEARIEQTLRHLLAQRGVEVECIVVDDRSTDGTSEILRRLAKEEARVQVQRVDVLPEDWLGKCHACHVGARAASAGAKPSIRWKSCGPGMSSNHCRALSSRGLSQTRCRA